MTVGDILFGKLEGEEEKERERERLAKEKEKKEREREKQEEREREKALWDIEQEVLFYLSIMCFVCSFPLPLCSLTMLYL